MGSPSTILQCPVCNGVFLATHQSGANQTCPHCAVSSLRSTFKEVIGSETFDQESAEPMPQTSSWVRWCLMLGCGVIFFGVIGGGIWWLNQKKHDQGVIPEDLKAERVRLEEAQKLMGIFLQTAEEQQQDATPSDEVYAKVHAFVTAFNDAGTIEERLKWIASPEKNKESFTRFFATANPTFNRELKLQPYQVTELPSEKKVWLYQANISGSNSISILRFHQPDESSLLLDWNFFLQTHLLAFDDFATKSELEAAPQWFTVLLGRRHDFLLKGPDKENYLAFEAQGSFSDTGTLLVYALKESLAARMLTAKMIWGRTYLTDVLIGKAEVEGQTLNVILDYVGTSVMEKSQ